ncbi:MAG: DEAD/DEAH box helicase family protein [Planctomycetes bacterium]|nr:DEAD/DEAH box helicase family protein [Planctomycetota bacterium]
MPPGTGKSYTVKCALAGHGVRALYVTPTHELAEQVQRDLEASGVTTHHWRAGPTEEDGCPQRELVQLFRALGYLLRLGPCQDCGRARRCPYREVFRSRANQQAQVLLVTSWHLRRSDLWSLRALENRPLVILDEDATAALAAPVELRVDRLRTFVDNLAAVREAIIADAPDLSGLLGNLAGSPLESVRGEDGLLALADLLRRAAMDVLAACAGVQDGVWRPAGEIMAGSASDADRGPLAEDSLMEQLLRVAYEAARNRTVLPNFFADLAELLSRQGPVLVSPGACRWPRQAFLPPDREVLVLDATAEPAVLEGILGRPVTVAALPPVEQQATVYQVMDRIATRSGNRKDLAAADSYLRRLVTEVAHRHRGEPLLCVSFKNDTEALEKLLECEHGQATVVHYGALRGLNAFAEHRVGLVIGRPMPNEASLQLLAVAAYGTEALDENLRAPPLQWHLDPVAIGPDLWTVRRQQYDDPRWQAVWRHLVTGELMQAIGRLRPLTNPATIYVVSNEPLPPELDVTAIYAGELFPRLATSGRRTDFEEGVLRYAEAAAKLEAAGLEPTNRAVCRQLGLRECNGFRYRKLALVRTRAPPP